VAQAYSPPYDRSRSEGTGPHGEISRSRRVLPCPRAGCGKSAPRNVVLNPRLSREKLGGRFLGHRVDLKAKAGGEKSMPEKQEMLEGAEDMVLQDPRDRAKAGLPESQSPVVEPHTHCYSA